MSTTSLTAGEVMDKSASLMNDTAKTVYTHAAQLPYLQMALDELQENFELNNISITSQVSTAVTVSIGTTSINPVDGIGAGAAPNYPVDLVEIQQVWERLSGSTDPYIPMSQREYLSHQLDDVPVESLGTWAFVNQRITFAAATTSRQVKIDYIKKAFPDLITTSTVIGIINARSYLYYRTAALCSRFVGDNPSRAEELDNFAQMAMDRVVSIGVKGKQSISTRRRPFMASYKKRTFI
jgi:hypothetical protein